MKRKFDATEIFIQKNTLNNMDVLMSQDTEKILMIRIRKKVAISRTQHEKNGVWKF